MIEPPVIKKSTHWPNEYEPFYERYDMIYIPHNAPLLCLCFQQKMHAICLRF